MLAPPPWSAQELLAELEGLEEEGLAEDLGQVNLAGASDAAEQVVMPSAPVSLP